MTSFVSKKIVFDFSTETFSEPIQSEQNTLSVPVFYFTSLGQILSLDCWIVRTFHGLMLSIDRLLQLGRALFTLYIVFIIWHSVVSSCSALILICMENFLCNICQTTSWTGLLSSRVSSACPT